jgi:hypothetical protein
LPQALKPTDRINAIARRTRKALPMVVPLLTSDLVPVLKSFLS